MAYLAEAGELYDANGMASTQLAAAVGYPGSSVAFAQLLSGMERSGLIAREVRGKRTYRIGPGTARAVGPARVVPRAGAGAVGSRGPGRGPGRRGRSRGRRGGRVRLRRTGPPPARSGGQAAGGNGRRGEHAGGVRPAEMPPLPARPDQVALQETVSGLEYELATAWTKHGKLAEENVRLREQLRAAQRSLALAAEQVRRLPASADLNDSEVVVLQRLLAPASAADSTDSHAPDLPARSTGAEAAGESAGQPWGARAGMRGG